MLLMIGYFFVGSKLVGRYIRPWRSPTPPRSFTVIGMGGFQPVASRREMSAFSSDSTTLPVASRNTEVEATSGFEKLSTKYLPDGDTDTA